MSHDAYTRLLHAALTREEGAPSTPAIELATARLLTGDAGAAPHAYLRLGNPTWEALERALGALEEADSLVFASGQAASFAVMLALGGGGTRFVLPHDGYYGTRKVAGMLAPFGVQAVTVDTSDHNAVRDALAGGSSVLWAESPSNPWLRVADLVALAHIADSCGAPFVVDNTTATAALQRPLDLGATVTVTSLTKSTSGHADVVLGSVATRDRALLDTLRLWRSQAGSIAGPFEAWLAHRGVLTLPLRIARQSEHAEALARFLSTHPRIRRVLHPSLDAAQRALVRAQMPAGVGPIFSFELDGDAAATERVLASSQLFRCATSFGGVESTWERRARWASETAPESLVRVSVGLEALADLKADLERSLDTV